MSILRVTFDVSVHNLALDSTGEVEAFRARVENAIREIHPAGKDNILSSDVEVKLVEYAGTPNKITWYLYPGRSA
jgi:hypothetical protein